MTILTCLLIAACVPHTADSRKGELSPIMKKLLKASKKKEMLWGSALENVKPSRLEAAQFFEYVQKQADYKSYHLLFALRRHHPDLYQEIDPRLRASILCSTLKHTTCLNDWGDLGLKLGEYAELEAAQALLELGMAAIPFLVPILDDKSEACLEGSEEATLSADYEYRRADWACQFISVILGIQYQFSEDPTERDQQIQSLRSHLVRMP